MPRSARTVISSRSVISSTRSPLTQITPASGLQQPENELEDRGLAGPAGAQEDLGVALEQREAHVAQDHLVVEGERDPVEHDDRRVRARRGSPAASARVRQRCCGVHARQYIKRDQQRVTKKSTTSTATDAATTAFVVDSPTPWCRPRAQADVAADAHDDEPEEERLDEPHPEVLQVQALEHRRQYTLEATAAGTRR